MMKRSILAFLGFSCNHKVGGHVRRVLEIIPDDTTPKEQRRLVGTRPEQLMGGIQEA